MSEENEEVKPKQSKEEMYKSRLADMRKGRIKSKRFAGSKTFGRVIFHPNLPSPKKYMKNKWQHKQYDEAFSMYLQRLPRKVIAATAGITMVKLLNWSRLHEWPTLRRKVESGVVLDGMPVDPSNLTLDPEFNKLPVEIKDTVKKLIEYNKVTRVRIAHALLRGSDEIEKWDGKEVIKNVESLKQIADIVQKIEPPEDKRPEISILGGNNYIATTLPPPRTAEIDAIDI